MGFKNTKRDKYDLTFSEFIKLRDKCCQKCGKSDGKLETSHIFSRKHQGLRCDPRNAMLKCFTCHRWWHENPVEAAEWLKTIIGEGEYTRLRYSANQVTKMTTWDKDENREQLKTAIQLMKEGNHLFPFIEKYRTE